MVINSFRNKRTWTWGRYPAPPPNLNLPELKVGYAGVTQLSTCDKGSDFTRLRNCRLLDAQALTQYPFKTVNANDNFANDNFEFTPVALAA